MNGMLTSFVDIICEKLPTNILFNIIVDLLGFEELLLVMLLTMDHCVQFAATEDLMQFTTFPSIPLDESGTLSMFHIKNTRTEF